MGIAFIATALGAVIGIPLGVTDVSVLAGKGDISWKFWKNFGNFFSGETSVFASFTDVFREGLIPEGVSFFTISVMVLSYSITKGIGIGLISFALMSIASYLVELIISAIKKTERPKWNVSLVVIIVSLLFAVYFFVPATLF